MSLCRRCWLTLLAVLATVLVASGLPRTARAQPRGADVSASVSSEEVEVGEPFTVELRAMSQGDEIPSDPQLYVPSGLDVSGPSVATRVVSRFGSGGSSTSRGIGATWQLTARRPGSYVIPAPTVAVGGERVTAGHGMRVKVVPATGRPRRRPGNFGFPSPFGPPGFGTTFPFNLGGPTDAEPNDEPSPSMSEEAQKLAMPNEPEPYVFLRAMADKKQAVVGEQVTLTFYVYYRADFEMTDRHEPALAEFLRLPMLSTPGADPPIVTRVGDHRYLVRLLDRMALFPLRAGSLHTGTLSARFSGSRVGARIERTSNDLLIEAHDPPSKGRPPGYRLGDVGAFRLTAAVEPREVDADGTVAVLVRLQGIGALPQRLEVPERTGVEWLDPEVKGEVTITNGKIGGWRTFGYVVRLHEPGERYLGKLELPFFDPERGEYGMADADLGSVKVREIAGGTHPAPDGGKVDDPKAAAQADPFASIGPARLSLQPFEQASSPGIEPRWFWAMVAFPPLAVALGAGTRRALAALARRRAERRRDPAALAGKALREVDRAADAQAGAAAAERAIHLAIEAATGLKARAVLLGELGRELERRGLSPELGAESCALLEQCTAVRFEPAPTPDAKGDDRFARRVRKLVERLCARAPKSGGAKPKAAAQLALLCALGVAALLLLPTRVALGATPEELFHQGTNALGEGKYDEAIAQLEAFADQGAPQPDASYDRGLGYVMRVRAGAGRPGDLGRAAAAFEEALLLRTDDPEAEHALELVQAEVARRGARRGKDVITDRPTLDRVLVGLGSERTWGTAAIVTSWLLGLGLVLRRRARRDLRIAGRVLSPAALVALVALCPLYAGARSLRLGSRPAVVVVPELFLADEAGVSVGGEPLPEAARVEAGEQRGRLLHVRSGSREGWVPLGTVRLLGRK